MDRRELLQFARGDRPAELVFRNAAVVNVFAGDVETTDVAIAGDVIVGLGHEYVGRTEIDLAGTILAPGFMDGHMHVESSMVPIPEFARAVVPRGTTTVVIDPHEIANVCGVDGIRYLVATSQDQPLDVVVMVPSAVPATRMETAGAVLGASELQLLLQEPQVHGLAELMNFPGVVAGDADILRKIALAGDRPIDGHAPSLLGQALNTYIAAGAGSDHECTTLEEAEQRLRRGMYVMIREASNARNLSTLLPLITPHNARRCMLVTDDRTPADLLDDGHIDHLVRQAIRRGLDPVTAIQLVTLNVAEYFGLRRRGAIAPGYRADLVVLDTLSAAFRVHQVYVRGRLVAADGAMVAPIAPPRYTLPATIRLHAVTVDDFRLPAPSASARVIKLVPNQLVTTCRVEPVPIRDGLGVADVAHDILKLAVLERHTASGRVGVGWVRGFGLTRGALASSVAHDSHNIVATGTNDSDMLAAVRTIAEMQGGLVVVADGQVLASVPLPIAGLMSDQPLACVRAHLDRLTAAAHALGCSLHAPFMALSFLALPVIPALKLTDHSLVDVTAFRIVPVFATCDDQPAAAPVSRGMR